VKTNVDRLQVPVNALLFRAEGLRAVVIDSNHHAHLQPLQIGRDFGTTLEVIEGLKADDWIVLNPPDSLDDGQKVDVQQVPEKPVAGAPSATPAPAPAGEKPGAKK
jgi:hypothetical protein